MTLLKAEKAKTPISDFRKCLHHFVFYFGPVKVCRFCGAQTIASVGGESKPIYPPPTEEPTS